MDKLGRYVLVAKIASGGMADVYRAKLIGIEGFEKDVAIKKILPHWSANRDFVDMLISEAKVLLHLTHTNIVQVYELNREEDIYYIVMEYVAGVDLRALIERIKKQGRPFPLSLAVLIAQKICNGLAFAHDKKDAAHQPLGIVHRDISPQNILVGSHGEIKITDFGIAKVVGKNTETATGVLKGKFSYMSPEQALGQKIDRRTDIFALGIILFEMATGERCFKGTNDLDTLEAVKRAEVVFPDAARANLPAPLCDVILKALQKEKEARYATAAELKADLDRVSRELGYFAGNEDVKMLVTDLFPERFSEKEKMDEELSQRSRKYWQESQVKGAKQRTRVLVRGMQLADETANQATVVSFIKTILWDKTQVWIQEVKRVGQAVLKPEDPRKKWLALGGGSLAVFLILVLAAVWWSHSSSPPSQSPSVISPVENPQPVALPKAGLAATSPQGIVLAEPPISNPIVSPATLSIAEPAHSPEKDKTGKSSSEGSSKTGHYGSIVVSVKPWGKVSVAGISLGENALLKSSRIPAGDQRVVVSFPPKNKTLSTRVQIVENAVARCHAFFGQPSTLKCD